MIEQELENDQELKGILGCVEPEKQDLPFLEPVVSLGRQRPVIGPEIISENFPCVDSSVGEGQHFVVNKLPPLFIQLESVEGPPIDCQPNTIVTNNISFPVNVKSLPSIRKVRGLDIKPYKIRKTALSDFKPRVVSNLVVPESNLAPKGKDPKVWGLAPESKKVKVAIAKLADENFFQHAGCGGFSQAARDAYNINKKFKLIAAFLSKPTDCNCRKLFEKS